MSKRKAAQAARESIRVQLTDVPQSTQSTGGPRITQPTDGPLITKPTDGPHITKPTDGPHITKPTDGPHITTQQTDGPHITEYSEKTTFNVQVKEEPQDDYDEPQYTWAHSPIADEEDREGNGTNKTKMKGKKSTEILAGDDSQATSSPAKIKKVHTPIVPVKIQKPSSLSSSLPSVPAESPAASPAKKKKKTSIPTAPANMKVKVIRACPKCTPIVMELADQANKATKSSQELKRHMEDATHNVEKVKVILDETFKKNRNLEERITEMQGSSTFSFPLRIKSCDSLMRKFTGVGRCSQFKWLFEKTNHRLSGADLRKLKAINLDYPDQLLAVLIFLRTNPSLDELSFHFSYDFTEDNFLKMLSVWLSVLTTELKPRINKPPNYILNTGFPTCFSSMGRNLQSIIHKFDILREKPAIFDAWQTSHCLKCIVAMSPKGSVMGVSQVVDQSVPDTDLFTFSELDKLFTVANIIIDTQALGLTEVVPFGVKVVEPPFDQELDDAAAVHIETVVKKLIDFRILQGPIARTVTKSVMDMVVTVCCGLLNLQEESQAHDSTK